MDIADTVDADFNTDAFCKYNDFKQIIPLDYAMPPRHVGSLCLLGGPPSLVSRCSILSCAQVCRQEKTTSGPPKQPTLIEYQSQEQGVGF